ncbi:pPIWI_RE module domain-containing protein [Micromonospora palythoicola]|uniref:pPIWI_RE module domain-containing protein n=1 Tax=Micromonospora palythoicola TaxID=3120507 RepID=UPI002FCE3691
MTYNRLRSTGFHLNLDAIQPFPYHALRYPAAWRKPLLDLFRSSKQRNPDRYRQVPIRALNDAIALLAPDMIRPAVTNTDWNGEDWLYATSPIPTDGIARILRAWIHTLGRQTGQTAEDHRLLREALAAVQPGAPGWKDFTWEPRTINFAEEAAKSGLNGTAQPHNALFTLLPHVLVGELTAPDTAWPHGQGEPIEFRRSVCDRGAEAVSWPPTSEELPFSYKATLQVQTVPGRPDPVVYANFGVRRWVYTQPKLPSTSNTSVYLVRSHPLLDKTGRSRAFRCIGIRWRPHRGTDWSDRLHAVLDHLALRPELPDPADLAGNPRAHLNKSTRDDGIAIVFRNELGKHAVEPGLSVRERRELFDWTSGVLQQWVRPDEPFTRVFGLRAFATSPKIVKNAHERAAAQQKKQIRAAAKESGTDPTTALDALPGKFAPLVRAGLAKLVDRTRAEPTVTIEVHHWQDSTLPQLVEAAITRDLGPATTTASGPSWQVGAGTLRMTAHAVRGDHADKIDIPRQATAHTITSALLARATDIQGTLPPAASPIVASIIEVNHRDYFKQRPIGDVKPAFRLAHSNTGRVTQFAYPPTGEKADRERITRVWHDLLRQLGVQLVPPQVKIRNMPLPDRIYYLAIWVVRTNKTRRRSVGRRVPVMVYLDSTGEQRPQLISPYFDDWMDYHEGLTRLARDGRFDVEARTPENDYFVRNFIADRLRDVTALRRDTLLLTDTGNLRPDWPFIGNGKLVFDHLDDQAVAGTGLRHVRVRDACDNLEVPDVWGVGTEEKNDWGLSGGLWRMHGDRVFASTADKPAQAGQTLHGLSKADSYTFTPRPRDGEEAKEVTIPPAPAAEVWNARMVEMTVAAIQPGDDPRAWVGIAHQLRWANLQYDDGTTLPMPLHLAQLAEEYVLGTQTRGSEAPEDSGGPED